MRTLSERLDRIPVGNDNASAFAHLEQRVSYLLERLEASSDDRSAAPAIDLGRVEEGLHDILRSLERQHASLVALADPNRNSGDTPQPMDLGIVDLVKRELSDIRFSQSETDRRTQDSLETVHSTLGHVVDRLSMIEGDLRMVRTNAPATPPPLSCRGRMREEASAPMTPLQTLRSSSKPELPNPAALQASPQEHFAAAPREFHAVQPPAAPPLPPRAISEILEPHAAAPAHVIAPELPPDHPLEPGTRPPARVASPSERIAASENAISEIAAAPKEPVSSSSFIAAARRAAQAAAAAPPPGEGGTLAKAAPKDKGGDKARGGARRTTRTLEHFLQDPLAAGRRERGRDRARHVQDGDDAARHRQRAATADDGTAQRAGRTGAGARAGGEQRQAGNPRRPRPAALDDVADAGREAVEQFSCRTEHAG